MGIVNTEGNDPVVPDAPNADDTEVVENGAATGDDTVTPDSDSETTADATDPADDAHKADGLDDGDALQADVGTPDTQSTLPDPADDAPETETTLPDPADDPKPINPDLAGHEYNADKDRETYATSEPVTPEPERVEGERTHDEYNADQDRTVYTKTDRAQAEDQLEDEDAEQYRRRMAREESNRAAEVARLQADSIGTTNRPLAEAL